MSETPTTQLFFYPTTHKTGLRFIGQHDNPCEGCPFLQRQICEGIDTYGIAFIHLLRAKSVLTKCHKKMERMQSGSDPDVGVMDFIREKVPNCYLLMPIGQILQTMELFEGHNTSRRMQRLGNS